MRTDKAQRKAEALLEEEEAKDKAAGKDRLNLVVVGHVDAGKSTLMGHLLLKLGQVSDRAMHKFQKEAREAGKASFAFAWVLDEHAEERSRGVTIDVAVNEFETERRAVTLLDAPGHRDFIPNMITGAAQADAAVLVVPATTNEFETAFQEGGQTREHAVLVRSLGVAQMVVAVNKMDTVDWSRARFEEIVAQVGPFLHSCGFRPDRLSFVPVSGLTGDNLASRGPAALSAWHSGACLAEAIDTFQPAVRPVRKPLRAVVSDVFRSSSMGHATVGCKVETGFVVPGDKLLLMPLGLLCTVKAIERSGVSLPIARAGDNVDVGLLDIDPNALSLGAVLCPPEAPVPATRKIVARIQTLPALAVPVLKGQSLTMHFQMMNEPCTVAHLIAQYDTASGELVKRRPRRVPRNATADVQINLERFLCMEAFTDFRKLGRFMLRDRGVTVAAGMVTAIGSARSTRK